MSTAVVNLLDYDSTSLKDFFVARGIKPFRARQVFSRLHRGGGVSESLDDCLIDLPSNLRDDLKTLAVISEPALQVNLPAADDSRKLLFSVGNGEQVEAVILPERRRTTLCISSQVGCALACRFCLTGRQGFSRNLTTAEIVAQLRIANRLLAAQNASLITNVVMMGMGEPLLNAEAVFPALRLFTDSHAYALSPRRVTVSTAGVVPALARLKDACNVSLAVSLHAPTDDLRDTLMPINRKYPLAALMAACRAHIADKPRAHVTFEYVMLREVNDDDSCARALVRLLHGIRCKVNLIPFNPFPETEYRVSLPERIRAFRERLLQSGIMTTIRRTRGDDILAACGQLAGGVHAKRAGLGRRRVASLQPVK